MSDFHDELDRKEAQRRIDRIRERPANLHDYQGCVNDPNMTKLPAVKEEAATQEGQTEPQEGESEPPFKGHDKLTRACHYLMGEFSVGMKRDEAAANLSARSLILRLRTAILDELSAKPQDEPKRPERPTPYEAGNFADALPVYYQTDADRYMDYLEGRVRELEEKRPEANWMLMVYEVVCEYGPPEYRMTEDGEAWYWCFPGHELPVADNLSELLVAGAQLMARAAVEKAANHE